MARRAEERGWGGGWGRQALQVGRRRMGHLCFPAEPGSSLRCSELWGWGETTLLYLAMPAWPSSHLRSGERPGPCDSCLLSGPSSS